MTSTIAISTKVKPACLILNCIFLSRLRPARRDVD
jgi:hypothetical protein